MDVTGPPARGVGAGGAGVRAVLFDVDGTLYSQTRLRMLMGLELALASSRRSVRTPFRLARVLSVFRRTRETLRELGHPSQPLEDLQFEATANRIDEDVTAVRRMVDEWILQRPLKHMARVRQPGLENVLIRLAERGVKIGALSDYPVTLKLDALGVAPYFSLGLCTTERTINAFKPHPQGFLMACDLWGLHPRDVVYVGDRPDVDGVGAAAAGMRCFIVGSGRRHHRSAGSEHVFTRNFDDLGRVLCGAR